jgi:hypothetical protein
MKTKLLFALALSFCSMALFAQTVGSGVTITNFSISEETLAFEPTTVGTTASYELLVTNLVGVTQDVTFSGVSAPFSLSESSLTLDAQEAAVITLYFNPAAVGQFDAEILFAGSIFGSGALGIEGEGTQIDIETDISFVQFDNTAIGSSSTEVLSILNAGSGTMLISSFDFSDSQFAVEETSLTIAEGESHDLVITYTPIFAGGSSETLTINSNDPNDPALVIDLAATGISEVSGELCGTWSVVNSPYILVDNVTVPDDCSLTIEAGVEVQGNGYDIIANGPLQLLGQFGNRVTLVDLDLDLEVENAETISFEYCDVEYVDITSAATGTPFEFDWNIAAEGVEGWYNSGGSGGSVSRQGDRVRSEYWSSTSSWRDIYFYSPIRNYSGSLNSVSFKRQIDDYDGGGNGSEYWRFDVSIDGGAWETIYEEYHMGDQPETPFQFDLTSMSSSSTIQFRFNYYFYRGHYFYLDDFMMDLGDEEDFVSNLHLDNVRFSKDFILTGTEMKLSADSLRTYYTNWNQTNSSYDVSQWEVEGHSEKDEGAWFRGDNNAYDFSHITLNDEHWSNEQGLDFEDIDYSVFRFDSCEFNGFTHGLYLRNSDYSEIFLNECVADSNTSHAFYFPTTTYTDFEMSGVRARENASYGMRITGSYNSADLEYSIFADNNSHGFTFECVTSMIEGDSLHVANSGFFRNNGWGLRTSCQAELEHLTILDNTNVGIYMDAAFYGMSQILSSSTLWGNGSSSSWDQLYISSNFINIAHTNVMGGSSGLTGSSWDLDDSFISDMPYFEDNWGHMEAISPGVDGGKPWEIDAHMPMGLGGVRADMGMYGGPNNAYWGGDVISDGSSSLNAVSDIPQDQGNTLGLAFSSSFWDNNSAIDPVTEYTVWRHMDVGGSAISDLSQGSWELVGEVPAQGFESYGFQAPTLGNTNQFGEFMSCYTVIAETAIDQLYWQSNVLCGESVDNLAPDAPEVETGLIEPELAEVLWFSPGEEDYSYTVISSDHGFSAEVYGDTVTYDTSVQEGQEYTYYVQHVDANGNLSDLTTAVLSIEAMLDIIPLNPGWNLISLDRDPQNANPEDVFSELTTGNLQYVTGFDGGAMIYDPNGLSFLNTLTVLEGGRGYWVKVSEEDELRVSGTLLSSDYKTPLASGWNLVGFTGGQALVADYYATEIANDELIYVTGFDEGSSVYDPNGLSFLNTLNTLENGFGYWVKVDLDNGLITDQDDEVSNVHDFVNGHTHDWLAGEVIDVVDEADIVVSQLQVLEGGWIRSTPLYGAETGSLQGLAQEKELHFVWNGRKSNECIRFDGNRKLHAIDLTFENGAVEVYPNPANQMLSVSSADFEPSQFQMTDAAGRIVMEGRWATEIQLVLDVAALPNGIFTFSAWDAQGHYEAMPVMISH